jgi:hypothetical protein
MQPLVSQGSAVTFTNVVGTGVPQWISFYYINTDNQRTFILYIVLSQVSKIPPVTSLYRVASVSVNGGPPVMLKQPTGAAGVVLSVPLQLTLKAGSQNNITVQGATGE